MATQKADCSDQSQGEPMAKRGKPARVTETSTTVQSTMACSEEHKVIESPVVEVSDRDEIVDEQHAEVIQVAVHKAPDPLEGTGCSNCTVLQNTVRKLKNRIVSLENKVKKWKLTNRRSRYLIEGEYSVPFDLISAKVWFWYQLKCLLFFFFGFGMSFIIFSLSRK